MVPIQQDLNAANCCLAFIRTPRPANGIQRGGWLGPGDGEQAAGSCSVFRSGRSLQPFHLRLLPKLFLASHCCAGRRGMGRVAAGWDPPVRVVRMTPRVSEATVAFRSPSLPLRPCCTSWTQLSERAILC